MSGFWLMTAATLALIGAISEAFAFFTIGIPGVTGQDVVIEVSLLWPQIGIAIALVAHLIIVFLGFLRRPEIKTIGVVAGYTAVAAILICSIFIGGRIVVSGDEGSSLIDVSIIGDSTWIGLIATIIVAIVTTYAASRRKG